MPKIVNASQVKDFRPIACYSIVHKLISKILISRLQGVITEVVSDCQSGFIPRRYIADNILLSTELIKGYSRAHISPRCVLKIDLKKTYESIEWFFLETVMQEFGFPGFYIKWVMACLYNYSHLLNVNHGLPTPSFQAKKGPRQGDPISPFLFVLGMEYMSRCMNQLKQTP